MALASTPITLLSIPVASLCGTPQQVPPYSDCSSSSTWAYWTVLGKGPDILSKQSWKAGYTGSMIQNGKRVDLKNIKPGDLIFYGKTQVSHVAIYIGNNQVVSHGSTPVRKGPVHYRSDFHHARAYL